MTFDDAVRQCVAEWEAGTEATPKELAFLRGLLRRHFEPRPRERGFDLDALESLAVQARYRPGVKVELEPGEALAVVGHVQGLEFLLEAEGVARQEALARCEQMAEVLAQISRLAQRGSIDG